MEQNEDGIKRATTDKQDLHETVTSLPRTQKYDQPNPQLTFFNRYFFLTLFFGHMAVRELSSPTRDQT